MMFVSKIMLDELRDLYDSLRGEMRGKWHRDLPLEELLFDRWDRARTLGFGAGSSIYHNTYVYGKVKVGMKTWVGPLVLLDGSGGLEIGDYCSISAGVQIYTHDSVKWALSGGKVKYEQAPVKIGNCCHIGASSVIARGVTIGEHSVVSAQSFVRNSVAPYSIVSGAPARKVGTVVITKDGEVQYEFLRDLSI